MSKEIQLIKFDLGNATTECDPITVSIIPCNTPAKHQLLQSNRKQTHKLINRGRESECKLKLLSLLF